MALPLILAALSSLGGAAAGGTAAGGASGLGSLLTGLGGSSGLMGQGALASAGGAPSFLSGLGGMGGQGMLSSFQGMPGLLQGMGQGLGGSNSQLMNAFLQDLQNPKNTAVGMPNVVQSGFSGMPIRSRATR